jgi:hypothetical protein
MANRKEGLSSTMQSNMPAVISPPAGSAVNHNACPVFGHPREHGPDGEPEVFFTGLHGKNYHGNIEGAAAKVHSTMGGGKK